MRSCELNFLKPWTATLIGVAVLFGVVLDFPHPPFAVEPGLLSILILAAFLLERNLYFGFFLSAGVFFYAVGGAWMPASPLAFLGFGLVFLGGAWCLSPRAAFSGWVLSFLALSGWGFLTIRSGGKIESDFQALIPWVCLATSLNILGFILPSPPSSLGTRFQGGALLVWAFCLSLAHQDPGMGLAYLVPAIWVWSRTPESRWASALWILAPWQMLVFNVESAPLPFRTAWWFGQAFFSAQMFRRTRGLSSRWKGTDSLFAVLSLGIWIWTFFLRGEGRGERVWIALLDPWFGAAILAAGAAILLADIPTLSQPILVSWGDAILEKGKRSLEFVDALRRHLPGAKKFSAVQWWAALSWAGLLLLIFKAGGR